MTARAFSPTQRRRQRAHAPPPDLERSRTDCGEWSPVSRYANEDLPQRVRRRPRQRSCLSTLLARGSPHDAAGRSCVATETASVATRKHRRDQRRLRRRASRLTASGGLTYRSTGATRAELQLTHRVEDDRVSGGETHHRPRAPQGGQCVGRHRAARRRRLRGEPERRRDAAALGRLRGRGQGRLQRARRSRSARARGPTPLVFLPTRNRRPCTRSASTCASCGSHPRDQCEREGIGGWMLRNVSARPNHRRPRGVHLRAGVGGVPHAAVRPPAQRRHRVRSHTLRQDWSLLDGYQNVSLMYRYLREDRRTTASRACTRTRIPRSTPCDCRARCRRVSPPTVEAGGASTTAAARALRRAPAAPTTSKLVRGWWGSASWSPRARRSTSTLAASARATRIRGAEQSTLRFNAAPGVARGGADQRVRHV